MRRWLARILICLILGAITTVAVAWACACHYWRSLPTTAWQNENPLLGDVPIDGNIWYVRRDKFTAVTSVHVLLPIGGRRDDGQATSWLLLDDLPTSTTLAPGGAYNPKMGGWFIVATGWPRRVLSVEYGRSGGMRDAQWHIHRGLELPMDPISWWLGADLSPALPLQPMWTGLALNTTLYAALWFAIIFGFGAARRGLRTKRGHCPMCAYDLRGGAMGPAGSRASPAGCPECGWNRAE